jgi:hypothetical protein
VNGSTTGRGERFCHSSAAQELIGALRADARSVKSVVTRSYWTRAAARTVSHTVGRSDSESSPVYGLSTAVRLARRAWSHRRRPLAMLAHDRL